MRTPILALPLLALAACPDRPLQTTDDGTTGTAGTTTTTGAPTTTDTPATTDATSPGGTTGVDDTTSSTGSTTAPVDTTSTATTTTGPPSTCGPPCDATWEHFGDLDVFTDADLACLTHVHGKVYLGQSAGPATVASLANLQRIDGGLVIDSVDGLTDLTMFACLEQADALVLIELPELADLSAMSKLEALGLLQLTDTGVAALPTFAPGFAGVHHIDLRGNPVLADLSAAATWLPDDESLSVTITDSPALTSLAGLGALAVTPLQKTITLKDLPFLKSLAGLEPLNDAALYLARLPALTDLDALEQMTTAQRITLIDLPQVTHLGGLSNLQGAAELMIGDCADMAAEGMAGLTSLAGLDSLTDLGALGLANNLNLESLDGAPKLTSIVQGFTAVNNPALTQKAYDALLSQLAAPPLEDCLGDWNSCDCFQILPW